MTLVSSIREKAVTFACGLETLVGVVSFPQDEHRGVGVVIVVGGPQYRAGSHRQFVLLARTLASEGFPTLRFDVAGMGDSTGDRRPFDGLDADLRAAVDLLATEVPGLDQVVLWGLCDGATASAMYLGTDPRVSGAVLVNPWVRNETSFAKVQVKHYYFGQLLSAPFWGRLLSGEVRIGSALGGLAGSVRRALEEDSERAPSQDFRSRMAACLRRFRGKVLLLMSGRDFVAREFDALTKAHPVWREIVNRSSVQRFDIAEADHTFSQAAWRIEAERATVTWLRDLVDSETSGERTRGDEQVSA